MPLYIYVEEKRGEGGREMGKQNERKKRTLMKKPSLFPPLFEHKAHPNKIIYLVNTPDCTVAIKPIAAKDSLST